MTKFLYFGTPWCGPCKQIKPLLRTSNKPIVEYNADTNKRLVNMYNIRSVPTLIVVRDGNEVERYVGSSIINFLQT